MKYRLDGGFLAYDLVGQGLPALLIHGYPLSRKIWKPQLPDLGSIATLVSIDLRGHGESFSFDPPYPMELLAEDCKRLLDGVNVAGPIIVCGLSMGGYVAFSLYRLYPQIIKGLILTSTRAVADSFQGKANRDAAVINVRDHGVQSIADNMLPKLVSPRTFASKPELVDAIREIMLETSVQGVIGASLGMRDRLDSAPLLPMINCPVLIIHGANDQLIPMQEAQAMHQSIPHSHLVVIPEAGHLPNMEQPELFNQAVRQFIQSFG